MFNHFRNIYIINHIINYCKRVFILQRKMTMEGIDNAHKGITEKSATIAQNH